MKIELNDDNSRVLGVGERIEAGDCCEVYGGWQPVSLRHVGALVTDVLVEIVRRPLPNKIEYDTGARRNDAQGRGRFDLIPYEAMLCLARRLEFGIKNGYEPRNWEKGMPLSRILSSMRRHASQVNYDFTEDHLGAVLFNAAAFVTIAERIKAGILPKELDDLGYLERTEPCSPSKS
jgi:hypothetical protein